MQEFVYESGIEVSPDGQMLAYCVREKPSDHNFNLRETATGTPSESVGCHVHICDRSGLVLKVIADMGNSWRPIWSPNSQKLSFYSDFGGIPQVWVFEIANGTYHRVSELPIQSSLFRPAASSWDREGKNIFIPAAHQPQISEVSVDNQEEIAPKIYSSSTVANLEERAKVYYFGQYCSSIVSIDSETGKESMMIPSSATPFPAFLQLSPTSEWISYLSPCFNADITHMYLDLAIARADGKAEVKTLATDLTTDQGLVASCYQWHPTEDLLVYIKEKKLHIVKMDKDGSNADRTLATDCLALFSRPLLFSHDGSCIVTGASSSKTDESPRDLCLIFLEDDRILNIPLSDKWKFLKVLKENERQFWQPEKDTITLFLEEKATCQTAIVRFFFGKNNEVQEKVLWRFLGHMGAITAVDDELFAIFEDVATPPNIHRFNADFSEKTQITNIDPRLHQLPAPKVVLYQTECPLYDGTTQSVKTCILLPEGDGKFPAVVIHYPGADHSVHGQDFMGGAQGIVPPLLFLQRGYAVILPEVCIGPEGMAGNPVQEMTDVLLPQIYHAIEKGLIDPERLGITGLSYGGYGTAALLTRTDLFKAGVAVSGIFDLAGMYGDLAFLQNDFCQYWAEHGQGRMGATPWDDRSRYLQNSPYYLADAIKTPLLLVHGEDDHLGGAGESAKMFTALKRLQRPVELLLYPKEGHVLDRWSQPNAIDASQRTLDFFDRHLKF